MYSSLNESATDIHVANKWEVSDGEITLMIADDERDEATAIAEDIFSKISKGVEPKDICILCKQTPQNYTPTIIAELAKYSVRKRSIRT